MPTFHPVGVAREYSCKSAAPRGRSEFSRDPAVGALMVLNLLPALFEEYVILALKMYLVQQEQRLKTCFRI